MSEGKMGGGGSQRRDTPIYSTDRNKTLATRELGEGGLGRMEPLFLLCLGLMSKGNGIGAS